MSSVSKREFVTEYESNVKVRSLKKGGKGLDHSGWDCNVQLFLSVLDQSRSLFSIDAVIGDLGAGGDIEVEHLQSEGAGLVHECIVENFRGVAKVTQVQACCVGYTSWGYLLGKSEVLSFEDKLSCGMLLFLVS